MSGMTPLSVLDLAPIVEGGDAGQALRNTLDLAKRAETLGYRRYWLAEHHNMPGVASAATAVIVGQVAAATSTIRVGAGGVMLPNHAPLVIAEQFGTIAALYPGRVDLGLGRAPGTDQITANALRRTLQTDVEDFPRDVMELIAYFAPPQPGQRLRAIPGAGLQVPVWILGSSTFGAQLAAAMGLPFAFASHFAPAAMMQAIEIYRSRFRGSEHQPQPHVMLGYNVIAAETDEEAAVLATSLTQAFLNLRRGAPAPLPPPKPGLEVDPMERAMLDQALSCSAVGSLETVKLQMEGFIQRTGADELMITSQIFDHAARVRSFEIAAQAGGLVPSP
jgi:luciferase family oxidoreductase group 1